MENNKKQPAESSGQIDNLFRKNLEGQQVEPGNHLWRGINRKLLLKEITHFNFSNFPGAFWLSGIAGIVIIPVLLYLTLTPGKKNTSDPNTTPKTVQTIPLPGTIKSSGAHEKPSVANPPLVSIHEMNQATKNQSDQSLNGKISQILDPSGSNVLQNEKKLPEIKKETSPAQWTEKKTALKSNPSQKTVQPANIASTAKGLSSSPPNTSSKHALLKKEMGNSIDLMPSGESESSNEIVKQTEQSVTDASITRMISLTSFDSLEKIKVKYPVPDLVNLGIFPASGKDQVIIPQYFSLGLEFMPEVTFYKTTSSYSKVNWWLGADLSYHLWKFYIRPGVRIGYMYDDGAYQVNYKRKDSIGFYKQVVSEYIAPQHPGVIIYNTINRTVYDSILHKATDQTRNRYEYIQVPLILGFDVFGSGKFNFSVQAGPVVSFFITDKETSSQNTELTNARLLTRVQSAAPGKDPNWQIWAAIHIDYRIAGNFDCYIEPTYKYYFSPMVGNEAVSVKAPWSLGLGIGFKYNFGFNTLNP